MDKVILGFVAAIVVLTWFAPGLSLYAFVAISPFAMVNDALGWDPRVSWALVLGLAGMAQFWKTGTSNLPSGAWKYWLAFAAFAVAGLWLEAGDLPADEFEASRTLLMYFIAGSACASGIWQLARTRRQQQIVFALLRHRF